MRSISTDFKDVRASTCEAIKRVVPAAVLASSALAAGLGVAACGGASANGVSSESAAQILSATASAMRHAKSAHIQGAVAGTSFDGYLYGNGEFSGTISKSGMTFQAIAMASSATYIKAPASFWQKIASGIPASTAAELGSKWVKLPASDSVGVAQIAFSNLSSGLTSAHGSLSKLGTKTLDGQSVIGVHSSKGGTIWVATSGTPYPVQLSAPSGSGVLTFTSWDQTTAPSAPGNALSLSSVLG